MTDGAFARTPPIEAVISLAQGQMKLTDKICKNGQYGLNDASMHACQVTAAIDNQNRRKPETKRASSCETGPSRCFEWSG